MENKDRLRLAQQYIPNPNELARMSPGERERLVRNALLQGEMDRRLQQQAQKLRGSQRFGKGR